MLRSHKAPALAPRNAPWDAEHHSFSVMAGQKPNGSRECAPDDRLRAADASRRATSRWMSRPSTFSSLLYRQDVDARHRRQVCVVCARQAAMAGHDHESVHFLLLGLWPAGVLPAANGLTGATPPFLRFLSAFGFFFSLLLRI